jgi:3-deoxy-manno-octulosonate cytidylyltransferase (CMP-KDO synthetase)
MKILGIIPARYGSTRFPAKALAMIGNKTMVQRVYEQACQSKTLSKVLVATDHKEIFQHVVDFGGHVVLTSPSHQSGTDRCFEAFSKDSGDYNYVINIQGDEPFIAPEQIDLLASLLDGETELATLLKTIESEEALHDSNTVKAIFNARQEAIYFSRTPIPYLRGYDPERWHQLHPYYKHIGIYAYRTDILREITRLKMSSLEKAESLEQLRWIEAGYKIKIAETDLETIGIDTPEDLEKVKTYLGEKEV